MNGAGKTTLMKTIAGLVPATAGRISFRGIDLTAKGSERAVDAGVVLVPEGRMVFPRMTVWENLMLGGVHPGPQPHRGERRAEAGLPICFHAFPSGDQKAATMSGGGGGVLAIGQGA